MSAKISSCFSRDFCFSFSRLFCKVLTGVFDLKVQIRSNFPPGATIKVKEWSLFTAVLSVQKIITSLNKFSFRLMQMCTLLDKASLDRLIVIWRIRPVKRCGFWNGKSKFKFKEALFFDLVFKVPTLCFAFSDLTGEKH